MESRMSEEGFIKYNKIQMLSAKMQISERTLIGFCFVSTLYQLCCVDRIDLYSVSN